MSISSVSASVNKALIFTVGAFYSIKNALTHSKRLFVWNNVARGVFQ